MGGQRHEAPVAPGLAAFQILRLYALAPLALDLSHDRPLPIGAALLRLEQPVIESAVALDVIARTTGGVEVDGLEGTHEAPAQGEAFAERDIHILAARIAVGHQPEGLLQESPLETIDHETID